MAPFARKQERCPPWGGCCSDKSVTPPSQTGTSAYRKIGIDIEPKCDRHRTSCTLRAITSRPHTVYSAELLRRDLERRAARAIIYYVDRYGEVHVRYHSDSQTWDIRSSPSGNPAKVPGTAGRDRTERINETSVRLILCPPQKSSSSWGGKSVLVN